MRTINLTRNQVAFVDDIDSDLLDYNWKALYIEATDRYCAVRNSGGRIHLHAILMHRVILSRVLSRPLLDTERVDHINLDSLMNSRDNLRLSTSSENQANRKVNSNNLSGFKGVCFDKRNNRWKATIGKDRKTINLGTFTDPISAAKAYDEAAERFFGEFARTNKDMRLYNDK